MFCKNVRPLQDSESLSIILASDSWAIVLERPRRLDSQSNWLLVIAALKQHNRIVYSSQAIHHVAQQISSLYWTTVTQASRNQHSLERGVERTVDLSSHMCGWPFAFSLAYGGRFADLSRRVLGISLSYRWN